MASSQELASFLASVEKRAFKQAVYAVRDAEAALDIVQDSMMRLSERYGDADCEALAPLFQRILRNTINDWFRRQKVRSYWVTLFSRLFAEKNSDGEDIDETEQAEALAIQHGGNLGESSADQIERAQLLKNIESEIEKLPARQREAFLLRYWEEMDVAETAEIMGCSEGSVKTHCSRAVHALARALRDRGITL